ncbi:MAG: alpha/beta hydrolase [Prevotella sp.]
MKKAIIILATVLAVVLAIVTGGSFYMLDYSLSADPNRHDTDSAYSVLYDRMPDMRPWVDSLVSNGLLKDTFVMMPSGERHHALYLRSDSAHGNTAVIVHGYKDSAPKFLFLGRMYHRDLGYNILMPDLHAHGQSEGDDIQMGWKDRIDVRHWTEVAEKLFRDSINPSRIVVHGVSMGAATTMCLSGEADLPDYIKCFVEDCGYTSVWDEFSLQLKEMFSLPEFPLMHTTSLLCQLRYGWSFSEASPIAQVAKCHRPMLFIHGDADDFVPYSMLAPLYEAKPQPKERWIAKGSKHARAYMDHPKEYTATIRRFLAKHI